MGKILSMLLVFVFYCNIVIEEASTGKPEVTMENLRITTPAGQHAYRQYNGSIYLVGNNEITANSGYNGTSGGVTIENNGTVASQCWVQNDS